MPTVLIVDDDPATVHLLRAHVKKAGYEVCTATDGLEALERISKQDFDALLLDLHMPNMNGLELLAALRKLERRPRAIMMTTDDTPSAVLKAAREQAYHYMKKPVDAEELLGLLEEVLAAPENARPIEVVSARPEWVELLVPCELSVARRVRSFLQHLESGLPEETRSSIGLAFHELLMNAVEWGGKLDPEKSVRITFMRLSRLLLYRIADPGKGFTFKNLTHAAVSNPDEDPLRHMAVREEKGLRPGGLGLRMTRELVDELVYNEAQNEVIFVKYLD